MLYYSMAFEANKELYIMALYHKARMLKMQGEYDKAKAEFSSFLVAAKKMEDREIKKQATSEMNGCDSAKKLVNAPLAVAVVNMGTDVNKPHIEFSPMPISDSEIIYGSLPETELKFYELAEIKPKRKLFVAQKSGDKWVNKGEMPGPINSETMHTGNGTFSPDGQRFYFTHCEENWDMGVTCHIWVAMKNKVGWDEPVKLDEMINMSNYSSSQPTVGIDSKKKKEIIYFVSNRPEGIGGDDIWYTTYDLKKHIYAAPKNGGKTLNSVRNEMSPFYYEKERKLYFSTEGRPGLGGFDIYVTRGELKKWSDPSNVGYPINSSVDDIYYVLNPMGESGYMVSNRKGGSQLLHETCCDDIYEFYKINPIHIAIKGKVVKAESNDYLNGKGDEITIDNNSSPIENTAIDIYIKENNQEIFLHTIETDTEGNYFLELEEKKDYKLALHKEGFLNNEINFTTAGITKSDTLLRNIGLGKLLEGTFIIENIEYEFNSAELTPLAKERIDNALLKVLIENPEIKIEIGAHTDNKGTNEYNKTLSQERAESVVKYLTAKNINPKRLVAKGYGETKPIALNENLDGSDNPTGRQTNRRTEFTIVGRIELPKVLLEED